MDQGAKESNEQMYRNSIIFILEMINERLDKIIHLLELRNSLAIARNEMFIQPVLGSCSGCTCAQKGKRTVDIPCPIHG